MSSSVPISMGGFSDGLYWTRNKGSMHVHERFVDIVPYDSLGGGLCPIHD
jgi:hypothetical protein